MKWSNIRLIFLRELRDQLRDRRTLFTIVVLPMLLYPLLGITIFQVSQFRREHPTQVWLIGSGSLPTTPALLDRERFSADFASAGSADLIRLHVDHQIPDEVITLGVRHVAEQAISDGTYDAVVFVPNEFASRLDEFRTWMGADRGDRDLQEADKFLVPQPEIFSNSANDKSAIAFQRVEIILRNWRDAIATANLRSSNIPIAARMPFEFRSTDLAVEASRNAAFWSKMLPFVVLVWALTGAFYPAVDLCAGEKERGTLETLLSSPALRGEIVWGKLLTVTVFSITTSMLNLLSLAFTGALFFRQINGAAGAPSLQMGLPPVSTIGWLLLALLPIAALFSALALGIAAFARSSKEGQYYLMPLLMITLPLMMLSMMPATELDLGTSLIPVTGMMLLLQALVDGDYATAGQFVVPVMGITGLCCWFAIRWAIDQFKNESVLFRESERFGLGVWLRHVVRDRGKYPTFGAGLLCGVLLLTIRFVGSTFATMPESWSDFVAMTLLTLIAFIGLPPLLMAFVLAKDPRATLGLKMPRLSTFPMAFLMAIVIHPVAKAFSDFVCRLYPISGEMTEQLTGMSTLINQAPGLWAIVLVMALTPAIFEELAFRGFILSSLLSRGNKWTAILLSSVFFGAAHGILQQSITAGALGLVIGYIAVQSRSILPAILFHFVYNSLSVSLGILLPNWLEQYPVLALFFTVSDMDFVYDWSIVAGSGVLSVLLFSWFSRGVFSKKHKVMAVEKRPLAGPVTNLTT